MYDITPLDADIATRLMTQDDLRALKASDAWSSGMRIGRGVVIIRNWLKPLSPCLLGMLKNVIYRYLDQLFATQSSSYGTPAPSVVDLRGSVG